MQGLGASKGLQQGFRPVEKLVDSMADGIAERFEIVDAIRALEIRMDGRTVAKVVDNVHSNNMRRR